MPVRTSAFLLMSVTVADAVALLQEGSHRPEETSPAATGRATPAATSASMADLTQAPDRVDPHGGRLSPHGPGAMAPRPNAEPAAIKWSVPSGWAEAPSPSAMRLATYQVDSHPLDSEAAEALVARAGGTPAANIDRWLGQFTTVDRDTRAERVVRGLKVHVVRIEGTYVSGGAMTSGAPAVHDAWALLGAVVESAGSPYFFKLTGPKTSVERARPAFDAWIASITPS